MPQPCILLKIQHIHYRFTWEKKRWSCQVQGASTAVPIISAGMCTGMNLPLICQSCSTGHPASPGLCFITHITDQSSLSCKVNNYTSIPEQELIQKAARKSHSSLKCPSVGQEGSEAHYARAVEGRGAREHHSSPDSQLEWWILKGKFCILKLCDLQLYK